MMNSVGNWWQTTRRWVGSVFHLAYSVLWAPHAYMIYFVTARCNARCNFCFYWNEIENASKRQELRLDEIAEMTRRLRHLLYLSVGGGEPFLRADLADLVGLFYRNCHTRFVNITTNGLQPERTAMTVERILRENPALYLKVNLSLDALGEKHDELRRVPGNFRKVMETHARLSQVRDQERFFGLNIATTFSSFNENEIGELIDYVDQTLAVNDHTLTFVRGDAKDPSALGASVDKYKRAVGYLESKHNPTRPMFKLLHGVLRTMFKINIDTLEQDRMIVPCVAGGKMITLDDQGMLKPCELLEQFHSTDRFHIGDIRQAGYDIPAMMRSNKAREVRKWIRDTKCHCTFECANMANVVFNARTWPKVLAGMFKGKAPGPVAGPAAPKAAPAPPEPVLAGRGEG